jgi:hypothetical protein
MNMHFKKMLAPIVITSLIVIYYIGFLVLISNINSIPTIIKLIGGIVPVLIAGACIYILIERIKEIRSGEEDDLSQY